MFRVSTTTIIRSTQNCNYSLRYRAATSLQRGLTLEGGSCTVPECGVCVCVCVSVSVWVCVCVVCVSVCVCE